MELSNAILLTKSIFKQDRDRGIEIVKKTIEDKKNEELLSYIEKGVDICLQDKNISWTESYSILSMLRLIVGTPSYKNFITREKLLNIVWDMLENQEHRVRIEAGLLLGDVVKDDPFVDLKQCSDYLLKLISDNYERQIQQSTSRSSFGKDETDELLHDTAGWKFLETSMKALQNLIKSCSESNSDILTPGILSLLFKCSTHINRFVRETCLYAFETLFTFSINVFEYGSDKFLPENIFEITVDCLLKLLCDDWSQVRLAASIATRKFLMNSNEKTRYLASLKLYPPICLNRHYLAEGVRLYNRETWDMLTSGEGRSIVRKNIDIYIDFHISQSLSDNQTTREAACICLSELGSLLSCNIENCHLNKIYEALNECLKDESWSVRDNACVAMGVYVSTHPLYFAEKLSDIFPFFSYNLSDSIAVVRVNGAVALVRTLNTFPQETFVFISDYFDKNFKAVLFQPAISKRYNPIETKLDIPEIGADLHDHTSSHTDKVMYSCDSLAPKIRSSKDKGGCCSSVSIQRDPQPWEFSDGCICLLGELSVFFYNNNLNKSENDIPLNPDAIQKVKQLFTTNLPVLAEVLRHKSFDVHYIFLQNGLNYLPNIAKYIGARSFKEQYLHMFLDTLEYCAVRTSNEHLKTSVASCFIKLKEIYGEKILKNYFNEYFGEINPDFVKVFSSS